jgi:hypothetical protein
MSKVWPPPKRFRGDVVIALGERDSCEERFKEEKAKHLSDHEKLQRPLRAIATTNDTFLSHWIACETKISESHG